MKKFINSFKKNIVLYLIWLIVAIIIVVWEFSILTRTKDNEKVDILINAHNVNEEELNEVLNSNKQEYLKEVNTRINDSLNGMFNQVMMTYGDVEADMYIISNEDLSNVTLDTFFYKLDELVCYELFTNDIEFYRNSDNEIYGIKYDLDCSKEENIEYYILFANDSLHLGKINNSEYDGAITICKALLDSKRK